MGAELLQERLHRRHPPSRGVPLHPQRIYMAGELSWERKDGSSNVWPFILLTKSGNPHLVFYDLEQEDGEAFNIMLVQGQDSLQDRLFSGGEEVGSQFTVFRRVM